MKKSSLARRVPRKIGQDEDDPPSTRTEDEELSGTLKEIPLE